jgi:gliding motility-associated-like protein
MNIDNKYTGFEKMLQDKLGNYEYSYDPTEWKNFEKDLPKGKGPFNFSNNLSKYLIITSAVIIPAFLILYFATDIFKSTENKDHNTSNTTISNDNTQQNTNSSDQTINYNGDENNNTGITSNNNSDESVSDDNHSSDNNTADKVTDNTKDNDNNNNSTNDNNSTTNKDPQKDLPKTVSSDLITSDIIEGCAPLKVKFTPMISTGSITYLWTFGDGKTSSKASPAHIYSKAGTYTVTLIVTLSDNKTTKKIEYANKITVKSAPVADFTYTNDAETDEYYFTDNSKESFAWSWSFGDKTSSSEKDPQHTYLEDGNYSIQLIVGNTVGCYDTLMKKITVKLKDLYYCPTGFTPNGDGLNDYFGPVGDRMIPDGYQMKIFDQNGIQVFETKELDVLWDGKNSQTNAEATQGMYYWKITMKDTNNKVKESTGYLTLMR